MSAVHTGWVENGAAIEEKEEKLEATISFAVPWVREIYCRSVKSPLGYMTVDSFCQVTWIHDGGLALLYIHRDVAVSRENVLRRFDCTGHRRLGQLLL